VRAGTLNLPDCDLDDGNPTKAAEYNLADRAYASLLVRLEAKKFDETTPSLRDNILAFYSNRSLPIDTRKNPARWKAVLDDLEQLKASVPPTGVPVLRRSAIR